MARSAGPEVVPVMREPAQRSLPGARSFLLRHQRHREGPDRHAGLRLMRRPLRGASLSVKNPPLGATALVTLRHILPSAGQASSAQSEAMDKLAASLATDVARPPAPSRAAAASQVPVSAMGTRLVSFLTRPRSAAPCACVCAALTDADGLADASTAAYSSQ